MTMRQSAVFTHAGVVLCLAVCVPSWAAAAPADDIAELKRAMKALQAENRALAKRVATLEAEKGTTVEAAKRIAPREAGPGGQQPVPLEVAQDKQVAASDPQPTRAETREREQLEGRVKELEMSKTAQEDAVRSIIRDSFSKLGSNINQSVALSGLIEVSAGRAKDFTGGTSSSVNLNAAELQFDIQPTPWVTGNLVVQYNDGTNVLFPTTRGFSEGVDRFTVDTAYINIGDTQRFPPYLKAGRMVLPFGISTGSLLGDVLTADNPLTVEAFEMRRTAIGFGLEFPTPTLGPPAPPVVAPPVKPRVLYPFIASLSRGVGYTPLPSRPSQLTPTTPKPASPPFHAGIYFYQGNTFGGGSQGTNPGNNFNATVGFRAKGHCGRSYEELRDSLFCPWSVSVDIDYNSSLFNSRFLEAEYRGFLDQIGFVRGMAASVKSTFGPISLIAEWNGAITRATFTDDLGNHVRIRPSAWQVSLGYQFDWNPWVEEIGAQGTFVAIGYSRSHDLAGVTELVNNVPTRVGFVPQKRFILTVGEWVTENLKVALEYSRNWDYSLNDGGTGNIGHGVFGRLTYAF